MLDLVQEIEAQIAGAKAAAAKQTIGVIREIGDGVARVEGLGDAMLNEMLDFGHGVIGLALNLDETEVGAIILGDYTKLEEGGEVHSTGRLLQVPVGKGLLGRVVNTLGEPLDGKGPIPSTVSYPVEKLAPGIIKRRPISQPVQTGIMPIDAMIPIGRGQRELIIGDRSTGKTTICIDTIISQARLNKAARGRRRQDATARSTPSTSRSARSSRPSRASSRCSKRPARCPTPSSSPRRPSDSAREPVPRAVRRRRDGRVVHGQRDGRADRLRRSLEARRRLPAGLAGAEAAVRARGLPGRRLLPPPPPARARRARRREVRRRLADGAADHRDAGGRRLGLHPDQRHLDHRRPDLPRDGPLLPGHPPRDLGRHLGLARRLRRAAQGDEAGRRAD